jgi:tRNA(Ile)-lysidine synthase
MHRYFDEVHSFIRTNDLLDRGEHILIAFSGGADSVFLTCALKQISQTYRYGWNLRLAHLNHGILEEADESEQLCRNLAERFELPISVHKVSIPKMLASGKYKGMNLESLGRHQRYRMFQLVAEEHQMTKLATGHQLDDQAETVLARAVSGTWLTGIRGIPVRRSLTRDGKVEIVRPLLRIARAQVAEWIEQEGIPYFEDPSNTDESFTRNKVRHRIIPMLQSELNRSASHHLAALGMQAQELETELTALAQSFLEPPIERGGETIVHVGIGPLRELGPLAQRYILRDAMLSVGVSPREVSHARVERVRDLLSSERRGLVVQLVDSVTVRLDDENLVFKRGMRDFESVPELITPAEFEIARDGTWVADIDNGPIGRVAAEMMAMPEGGLNELLFEKPQEVEYLDAEKVLFPMFVRGRKDGDRLMPLGMDGEKKLQDILVDNKVPKAERDVLPLVCDSNGILVVSGQCIAHRARVTPTTAQVLKLTSIARPGRSDASGFLPPIT